MNDLYQKFKKDSKEFELIVIKWNNNFNEKQIQNHKHQLEQAKNTGKRVWILFRYNGTHAKSITFSELKIPSDSKLENTVSEEYPNSSWFKKKLPVRSKILRAFLKAQKHAAKSYYDITEHLFDFLDGDYKVAEALISREILLLELKDNPNQAYDILNQKDIQKLLEDIYEPYFQRFGDYFGETIAGIQIEPPELLDYTEYNASIPWTPEMPEFFSKMKEYSLFEYIPLMFYETYDSATVRHDFWQVLIHLCSVKYVATIRKWANNHKVKLAVSLPLSSESFNINSVVLSQNAEQLCIHKPERSSDLTDDKCQILIRQTSSYQSPNLLPCPFSSLPFYDFAFQYFSRINLLTSLSRRDSSIMVIYPMSSFWVKSRGEKAGWILENLVRIDKMLKGWGYDYDYGDEDLIAKVGKINKKEKTLEVECKSYSIVVIPPCITLQESTVKILREFISAKGKLIALEPIPYLLKGKVGTEPYPLESLLYNRRTTVLPEDSEKRKIQLKKILDNKLKPELNFYLRPKNPQTYVILQHRRKYDELYLYFLFNSRKEEIEVLLEFDSEISLEEWHLADGTHSQPEQWHANGKTYAELSFSPKQIRIFIVISRKVRKKQIAREID